MNTKPRVVRKLMTLLVALVLLVAAEPGWAATSPIALTHSFTASTATGTVHTVFVRVENTGNKALANITLSLAPQPPLSKGDQSLTIANLGPRQSVELPLKIASRTPISGDDLARRKRLLFAGKCTDDKGRSMEFPIISRSIVPRVSKMPAMPVEKAQLLLNAADPPLTVAPRVSAVPAETSPRTFLFQCPRQQGLDFPYAIAIDGSGNIYVADTQNDMVQKFDSNRNFVTGWGRYGTDNGLFAVPWAIAADSAGNVYVADATARIQKFDGNGNFISVLGSYGSAEGQFSSPVGLAIDSSDNIYVTDNIANRIQKFDSGGSFVKAWGSEGSGNGQFSSPTAIAVDATGNIYVTDSGNNRIQKFDSSGNFLKAWGNGGTGNGQFNGPLGVAADRSGNVYVTDSGNYRIEKFDADGTFLTAWGEYGYDNGQLNWPRGIAVDTGGNVYIADTANSRIQEFGPGGNFLVSFGSMSDLFVYPTGMAVAPGGSVFVADPLASRLLKFDSSGNLLLTWGTPGSGDGQFNYPEGVAVDGSGNVLVADSNNGRIQKFDSNGKFLSAWGSFGAGNGQFNWPEGVAVDGIGNVLVADTFNHRIQKFDSSGNFVMAWGGQGSGPGQFSFPTSVVLDGNGNIYVADGFNNRIQKFDGSGKFISAWGSYGSGNGQFTSSAPGGLAIDADGNLYASDGGSDAYGGCGNCRVQVFDLNGNFRGAWGSFGSAYGQFESTSRVAVESSGTKVYVSDPANGRIEAFRRFFPNVATKFAVSAPASAIAGSSMTFTVTALDPGDAIATSYGGTVQFSSSDPSATLPANATLTNGTGTFTATLRSTGTQTLSASDTADGSLTGTSNAIAVTLPLPDLAITKRHAGAFEKGHIGTYVIKVKNSGNGPSNGTVTVRDTLPRGLTNVAMSGRGWTCRKETPVCSTSASLAAGASYPPIILKVKVAGYAPAVVTNTVTVSGGGEADTSNNVASDRTRITHHEPLRP